LTVKGYRKAVYARLGVTNDRDLRRLLIEAAQVVALGQIDEIVSDERAQGERLRLIPRPGGRRAAWIDYGPARGRPLMVTHGHSDWRRLPSGFVDRLHRDGWRPMVVQRPGFGLTDPAAFEYLADAGDDMAAVLDAVGGARAAVFARGPGFPTALAFALRHPERFDRAIVANPHPTRRHVPQGGAVLFGMLRLLSSRPRMVTLVARRALQHTSTASLRHLLPRLYSEAGDDLPADRPDIVAHQIADIQALYARSTRGVIDELALYARGWSTPSSVPAGPWRIAISRGSWSEAEAQTCLDLPGYERREIEGVVVLRAYTHPDSLADLLRP
jgi:pimeloyl-ACP methyl ester carboxylesterase